MPDIASRQPHKQPYKHASLLHQLPTAQGPSGLPLCRRAVKASLKQQRQRRQQHGEEDDGYYGAAAAPPARSSSLLARLALGCFSGSGHGSSRLR